MEWITSRVEPRLLTVLWISTSVITTSLLLTGELIFPLHILFTHLVVAQILQGCYRIYSSRAQGTRKWVSYRSLLSERDGPSLLPDISSLVLCGLSVPILLNGYKAAALSNDLPNLMLILALDWRPVSLLQKLLERKLGTSDLCRYLVFVAGAYLICVCNFRLRLVPLRMSIEFLVYSGLARIFSRWQIGFRSPYGRRYAEEDGNWSRLWLPVAVAAVGLLLIVQPERINPDRSPISASALLIAVISVLTTSSLFAFGLEQDDSTRTTSFLSTDGTDLDIEELTTRLTIAGCVTAAHFFLSPHTVVVSPWQYAGFLMAMLPFVELNQIRDLIHWVKTFLESKRNVMTGTKRDTSQDSFLILFALACAAWTCVLYGSVSLVPPSLEYTDLNLNSAPAPAAQFDIVLARYDKSAIDVASTVDAVIQSKAIEGLEIRLLVYNKNEDTPDFEQQLRSTLISEVEILVETLNNVGREADTYLHHIITRWDSLSDHTLFAQAEIENLPMALYWMNSFFVPETGFLQMSYEGRMCADCDHCGEWTDDPAVISKLFDMANPGKPCRDLVWNFRGQFVVSGQRIRANDKSLYEYLVRQLRDPESEMHSTNYVNSTWHSDQVDSLNDPIFGFTLERFWGVLMQCSEARVGQWSPSQLAAYARPKWLVGGFSLDHVQCLDRSLE